MRVVVLTASGLQPAYLGCYGSEWVETPNLDRLASEGIVFDRHYADCPHAGAARRAWRTGCFQVPAHDRASRPATGVDLLALLAERDIGTALVTDARPETGEFSQGWHHVHRVRPSKKSGSLEETVKGMQVALHELAKASAWLCWIDCTVLLPPWTVPREFCDPYFDRTEPGDEEYASGEEDGIPLERLLQPPAHSLDDRAVLSLQRSYAGAVSYLDAAVGAMRDELEQRGLLQDTMVIVTSDCGLPLGEHGTAGMSAGSVHEESVHLPLIVRLPRASAPDRRVAAITQAVDLMPVLADALELSRPATQGQSLLPLCQEEVEGLRPYAFSAALGAERREYALRTTNWTFLVKSRLGDDSASLRELFVKPDDRGEVNNLVQHHLELAAHLEEIAYRFADASRLPGPLHYPELRDVEGELQQLATEAPPPREDERPAASR
jgi:arylsulfatase A-like enzyme